MSSGDTTGKPAPIALPSLDDPVAASSVGWMGGRLGLRARVGGTWWTPLRVLVALAGAGYIVGYLLDLPCRSNDWAVPDRYEHLCYTDIAPLYSIRGFADGLFPYLNTGTDGQYLEYPVLTGMFMEVAGLLTSAVSNVLTTVDRAVTFFDVNVVLLFIALAVTVIATALTVRRRPWDAAMVALAPTVILAATINWDLLPLAFAGVALLLWSRRYPFLAGALLGLAVAAKFYPVFFLGAFVLLSIRTRRWRAFWRLLLGTVVTWAVVNLPFAVANPEGWAYFYRFSSFRGEDFGSIWFALTQAGAPSVPADRLNQVATGGFLLLCVGIAAIALTSARKPRLAQLLFLIIAAFVITNKVYSPQYSLWLVPLAVMARPRWRDFLIWQAGEVVYFLAIWWFLAGYGLEGQQSLIGQQYALATLIHVLVTLYFAGMVIRDIYIPQHDPVRSDGFAEDVDDPGGGVYDDASRRVRVDTDGRR